MNSYKFIDMIKTKYKIYPHSINELEDSVILSSMGKMNYLIVYGNLKNKFFGKIESLNNFKYKVCPQDSKNGKILRELLSFLNPIRVLNKERIVSFDIDYGISTHTNIKFSKTFDFYPVLSQFSIDELHSRNRSFEDILDFITYRVFENGYKDGYGIMANNLSTSKEIEYALENKTSIISYDVSSFINNNHDSIELSNEFSDFYISKDFTYIDSTLKFDLDILKNIYNKFDEPIKQISNIYNKEFKNKNVDFIISFDKFNGSLKPIEYLYLINELRNRDILFDGISFNMEKEDLYINMKISNEYNSHLMLKNVLLSDSDLEEIGRVSKGRMLLDVKNELLAVLIKTIYNEENYRDNKNIKSILLSKEENQKIKNLPNNKDKLRKELMSFYENNVYKFYEGMKNGK